MHGNMWIASWGGKQFKPWTVLHHATTLPCKEKTDRLNSVKPCAAVFGLPKSVRIHRNSLALGLEIVVCGTALIFILSDGAPSADAGYLSAGISSPENHINQVGDLCQRIFENQIVRSQ